MHNFTWIFYENMFLLMNNNLIKKHIFYKSLPILVDYSRWADFRLGTYY